MTVDEKRLRELAGAATPGPWQHADAVNPKVYLYSNPANSIAEPWERLMLGETYADGAGQGRRNLAFIAAANPQTVIALLDEIEKLRTRVSIKSATVFELTQQVAAMTAARDELFDLFMANRTALDTTTAGRVAELRKVGAS